MADKKISELDAITGAATAADDFFIVVDTSGSATKKISRAELNNAIEQDVLAQVDITSANIDGGTIDNTPIGATTPSTGDFTTVDTTGDVTVGGNLTVNGTTTTVNSTTLEVDDINITVASGAADAAAADGAGLTVDGASATFNYASSGDKWTMNKPLDVTGTITSDGLTVDGNIALNGSNMSLRMFESDTTDLNTQIQTNVGKLSFKTVNDAVSATTNRLEIDHATGDISFFSSGGASQGFFWDASTQRLGLGTTGPATPLDVRAASPFIRSTYDSTGTYVQMFHNGSNGYFDFSSGSQIWRGAGQAERMRIDSSGNLVVGATSAYATNAITLGDGGILYSRRTSGGPLTLRRDSTDGAIATFEKDGTTVGVIGSQNWGIGTSSPSTILHAVGAGGSIRMQNSSGTAKYIQMRSDSTNSHIEHIGGPGDALRINNQASGTVEFLTANTEAARFDSSQNFLVGTTSSGSFSVSDGAMVLQSGRFLGTHSNDAVAALSRRGTDGSIVALYKDGTQVGSIGTQNWGIGTASPSRPLDVVADANDNPLRLRARGGGTSAYITFSSNDATTTNALIGNPAANTLAFYTNGFSERMRIDSSGYVGISTSNPQNELDVRGTVEIGNGSTQRMYLQGTGDDFRFYDRANLAERMRITSGGNVGIGVSSPAHPLSVENPDGNTNTISMINNSSNLSRLAFVQNGSTTAAYSSIDADGRSTGFIRFNTNDAEAMRIDSSGNVLVGKTSSAFGTVGGEIKSNGQITATATNAAAMQMNRKSSDGTILNLAKDNSTVGRIGCNGGEIWMADDTYGGFGFSTHATSKITPCDSSGANNDNVLDLGHSDSRFDDIYATNGTIQTSDQNEKQQIASLTDAEITAAKAISQLFKTFKWNDKVAAKGDAARTHTGVIAQDVEAAMTAAGLDAGDYAFFISATWWEADGETYYNADDAPEGATQHNRKGIRYPELLSFVGAATEQRLANIETRLTALEAN